MTFAQDQLSHAIEVLANGYHDNTAVATSDQANASSGTVHVVLADLFHLMV